MTTSELLSPLHLRRGRTPVLPTQRVRKPALANAAAASALAIAGASLAVPTASGAELAWLPFPADNIVGSYAYDVSADGAIVIGYVGDEDGIESAFWWDAAAGMTTLPGANAYAISADGSTVVGFQLAFTPETGLHYEAMRWTRGGAAEVLGTGGYDASQALGVSSDGGTVVGSVWGAGQTVAFAWTEAGGMELLGWMDGGAPYTSAQDVSDTGVVVGFGRMATGGTQAFYTQLGDGAGLHALDGLAGADSGTARAISRDARFVVGVSNDLVSDGRAVMWTQDGLGYSGPVALDGGSDWSYSEATDVSGDGTVVVGSYYATDELDGISAFRWTEASGAQSMDEWLEAQGVVLGDWELLEASAVSEDGGTIVGWGHRVADEYQAFVARGGLLLGIDDFTQSVASLQAVARLPLALSQGRVLQSMPEVNGMPGLSAAIEFDHVNGSSANLGGVHLDWHDTGWALTGGVGVAEAETSPLYLGGQARFSGLWASVGGALDLGLAAGQPALEGVELSGNLRADLLTAQIDRNYFNGAAIETASGHAGASNVTGALRASWHKPVGENLVLSPYAQWLAGRGVVAGYVESGGAGAGTVSEQVNVINLVTLGLDAEMVITDGLTLGVTYAFNHLIDGQAGAVGVTVPGAGSFAAPATAYQANWHNIGMDLTWAPNEALELTSYASANLGGKFAENWAIGGGVRVGF